MRPPTAQEIEDAKHLTGDPLTVSAVAKVRRPPGLHKRPRGRPRKDGQPPHQTPAGAASERAAAAAAVYAATNPANKTHGEAPTAAAYIPDTIDERIKHLQITNKNARACRFLQDFATSDYKTATEATGATPCEIAGWKNNEEFRRIFETIQAARDAATVARTCGTLADLANGEYKPKPDCLPPDTRAASLLLPALDGRFRAGQQGNAQQVQINISI